MIPISDAASDSSSNIVSPEGEQAQPPAASGRLQVRIIQRGDVTPEFIAHWRNLETHSIHPSVFLSADFLVPAWQRLEPEKSSFLMTVSEPDTGRLLLLGNFDDAAPTSNFPLPHLVAAKTIHTFRTHLLLDDVAGEAALSAWLAYIARETKWQGVIFPNLRFDARFAALLQATVNKQHLGWYPQGSVESAAVFPSRLSPDEIQEFRTANKRKSFRRNQKYLETFGKLHFSHITSAADLPAAIETFLVLEDSGWKHAAGTSIRSSAAETAFLYELLPCFLDSGRLSFTQLRVGDRVAAIAVNLLSGTTLFAFKIAWDPAFKKGGPGSLHELFLVAYVLEHFPQVTCIDSCAQPDSYLEDLWPHRIPIGQVALTTSRLADALLRSVDAARRFRQQLKRWW